MTGLGTDVQDKLESNTTIIYTSERLRMSIATANVKHYRFISLRGEVHPIHETASAFAADSPAAEIIESTMMERVLDGMRAGVHCWL